MEFYFRMNGKIKIAILEVASWITEHDETAHPE